MHETRFGLNVLDNCRLRMRHRPKEGFSRAYEMLDQRGVRPKVSGEMGPEGDVRNWDIADPETTKCCFLVGSSYNKQKRIARL